MLFFFSSSLTSCFSSFSMAFFAVLIVLSVLSSLDMLVCRGIAPSPLVSPERAPLNHPVLSDQLEGGDQRGFDIGQHNQALDGRGFARGDEHLEDIPFPGQNTQQNLPGAAGNDYMVATVAALWLNDLCCSLNDVA